jgi:hypothetical protein
MAPGKDARATVARGILPAALFLPHHTITPAC